MMISFFIEDSLTALGHTILGPASRVANALRLVETDTCDLALLDINIAGEQSYPVAKELKSRGIPFVFLSGYGSRGLSGEWIDSLMLAKPFAIEDLNARIATAMGTAV